jgi:hypothetical protein
MRLALPQADGRPALSRDVSAKGGAAWLPRLRGPALAAAFHGCLAVLLLLTAFPAGVRVATKMREIPVEIVPLAELQPKPKAKKPPAPKPRPEMTEKVPATDLTKPVPPPPKLEPPRDPQQASRPPIAQSKASKSERKTAIPPKKKKTKPAPKEKTARLKPDKYGIKVRPEAAATARTGAAEPLFGHWVLDPLEVDLGQACGSERLTGTIRIVRRKGDRYYALLRTTINWSLCEPQGVLRRIMLHIRNGRVTMYDGGGILDHGTIKDGVMVLRDAYGPSVWRKTGKKTGQ